MDTYHYALSQIQLYGPTNFSIFLDHAIQASRNSVTQQAQSYNILLVITVSCSTQQMTSHDHLGISVLQDGVISDMARTVDKIVEASKLPLSIVIVGVGGADFSNMVRLHCSQQCDYTHHGIT